MGLVRWAPSRADAYRAGPTRTGPGPSDAGALPEISNKPDSMGGWPVISAYASSGARKRSGCLCGPLPGSRRVPESVDRGAPTGEDPAPSKGTG